MKKVIFIITTLLIFISCEKIKNIAKESFSNSVEKEMDMIYRQVINDSVEQLEIVMKGGSSIDICVQAGMVSAAFLQAKDEEGYLTAKKFEKKACNAAGLDY